MRIISNQILGLFLFHYLSSTSRKKQWSQGISRYHMMMICWAGRNLVSHSIRAICVKTIKSLANNCKSAICVQNDIKIATYRVGILAVFSPASFQLRFRLWLGQRLRRRLTPLTGHFLRCFSINQDLDWVLDYILDYHANLILIASCYMTFENGNLL